MISERFERLLDGLVAAMREDQGCGIKVELIVSNMRNEVKVLTVSYTHLTLPTILRV